VARRGKTNDQAAAILGIGAGLHEALADQTVHNPFDRGPIHSRGAPQVVLRLRPKFGQPCQHCKLGCRHLGDHVGKQGQVALRYPAQDIADLVIQTVAAGCRQIIVQQGGRFGFHSFEIASESPARNSVDRRQVGAAQCLYTNKLASEMTSYLHAATLDDALRALGPDMRILAGGTDIYPATQQATLAGGVIDVAALPGLRGISQVQDGLRIGACTTWTDIAKAALPPALKALQQAALQVGGTQIQNAGTLGGNLCNASPAADGVPPLLAVDAVVELVSAGGIRQLALSAFLLGPRKTARQADEILTAILIPNASLAGQSSFIKLGARAYLVISIAMVAVRITAKNGRINHAALAVGACSATALRLGAVEATLIGRPITTAAEAIDAADVAAALSPMDDLRATAQYRTHAATELLRRAVAQTCKALA